MKLLFIKFDYEGTQDEIDTLEQAIASLSPGVKLTKEGKLQNGWVIFRADSHDPLDFFKIGAITAVNTRAYEDHRKRVKSN